MAAHRTSNIIKLLNGSLAHDPQRYRDEKMIAPRDPKPALPPGVLEAVPQEVRDRYRWLCREHCLPTVHGKPDGIAILRLAETQVARDVAAAKVAQYGTVMKHPRTGKPMQQPYFQVMVALNESCRRQENELGFTAASRLRHAPPGVPTPSESEGWDAVD
jgi:hypothetical protein